MLQALNTNEIVRPTQTEINQILRKRIPAISIKCMQLNMQRSLKAVNNIRAMINQFKFEIAFVQEPYTINNKVAAIPKMYRTFSYGNGRRRTAIIISNKNLDVLMINQLSDEDCVVIEINYDGCKLYGVSMYCDYTEDIDMFEKNRKY